MSLKTITVCLNETKRNPALLSLGAGLARDFDALLAGLYVIPAARIYPSAAFEPIPAIYEAHRDFFKAQSAAVRSQFEAAAAAAGVRQAFRVHDSSSPVVADSVIDLGREADLVIVSQTDSNADSFVELDFVERVALGAGRPVLVVPWIFSGELSLETVVLAWNGNREAARAAFDSLPLLKRARDVRVVWVDPQKDLPSSKLVPGAEIAESLARHGVKATVEPLPTSGTGAGEALMTKVSDSGAGLLVMGAYGHSRLLEFVLGGATRTVLAHMKCPVLLSH